MGATAQNFHPGDELALVFARSAGRAQLASGAGQDGLGAAVGTLFAQPIPIGCNRAEILAVGSAAVTLAVRRQVEQPAAPSTELAATVATITLAGAGSGAAVIEVPPNGGRLSLTLSGMAGATAVDAVVSFWRQ